MVILRLQAQNICFLDSIGNNIRDGPHSNLKVRFVTFEWKWPLA
jgi:hypothetical protein